MSSVKLDTGGLAITQVAAVVRDLRSSLEAYHKALGWGPWNVYEHKPPMLHSTELHGKPTEFTMLGAECHAGPIVFELLQPLEGPSIYKEWLDEHGEGLHHVAVYGAHARAGGPDADALPGARSRGADGWPDRRDDPVLLPRHRADAEGDLRVGLGPRGRPEAEPGRIRSAWRRTPTSTRWAGGRWPRSAACSTRCRARTSRRCAARSVRPGGSPATASGARG